MPLYEYACDACTTHFDEFRPVGSEPPPCPTCKGASRRVWTVPATEWNPPLAMMHRMSSGWDGGAQRGSHNDK